MRHSRFMLLSTSAIACLCLVCLSALSANDDVYSAPAASELHEEVLIWIEQKGLANSPIMDAIEPYWTFDAEDPDYQPTAAELFTALIRTFYLADDEVRALVDQCHSFAYSPALLELSVLDRNGAEPLLTHNVRYFLARHLSLLTAYEESHRMFEQVDLRHVVDPGSCLFHKAVCEHHLLLKEPGLDTLTKLLDQTENLSLRHRTLGELMRTDLQELKEKSLGEVARQMKDVERQLELGRTGGTVQIVENNILETLDELIKKMEEQQQQQQSSSSGAANPRPDKGAEESYLGGIKGEGLTDKKNIGRKDNWGDLPPKAQEAAKNMLDRQFPAHYRQAVEEYLKKLAERPAP